MVSLVSSGAGSDWELALKWCLVLKTPTQVGSDSASCTGGGSSLIC